MTIANLSRMCWANTPIKSVIELCLSYSKWGRKSFRWFPWEIENERFLVFLWMNEFISLIVTIWERERAVFGGVCEDSPIFTLSPLSTHCNDSEKIHPEFAVWVRSPLLYLACRGGRRTRAEVKSWGSLLAHLVPLAIDTLPGSWRRLLPGTRGRFRRRLPQWFSLMGMFLACRGEMWLPTGSGQCHCIVTHHTH